MPDIDASRLFFEPVSDPSPKDRLCLALQYWDGDREQAMKLALALCGVEKAPRNDVLFLIVHRRDADPPDREVVDELTRVFRNVRVIRGIRGGTGHPDGCNALWTDTVTSLGGLSHVVGHAFTMESDVIPIRRDWINMLKCEVQDMIKVKALLSGFWQPGGNPARREFEHINGNMLIDTTISRKIQQIYYVPTGWAWDVFLSGAFKPVWKKGGWIFNSYAIHKTTKHGESPNKVVAWDTGMFHEKQKQGYALIHGVRDDSGFTFLKKVFDANPASV